MTLRRVIVKFQNTCGKEDPANFQRGQIGNITKIQYSQLHPHKLEDSSALNLREDDLQAKIFYPNKLLSIGI